MIIFSTVFVLNFQNICAFPDVQLRHFVSTSWLFDHTLHAMLMISLPPLTFFLFRLLFWFLFVLLAQTQGQKATWLKLGELSFISDLRSQIWCL